MAKRITRPADLLSTPELKAYAAARGLTPEAALLEIEDDAYDREMEPFVLLQELQECREAEVRMADIDAKKLAEMQAEGQSVPQGEDSEETFLVSV